MKALLRHDGVTIAIDDNGQVFKSRDEVTWTHSLERKDLTMGKIPSRSTGVQNLDTADNTVLRKSLSKHVGKICAYHNVGKFADAKDWAHQLVQELNRYGLI